MNCIKCGREIEADQVFCQTCLEEMEKYPVHPGTAVHIPARGPEEEHKKNQTRKKQVISPSEQILKLKTKVRQLRLLLALMLLLCGLLCFVMGKAVMELDIQRMLGQNYNTVENAETTPPD